MTLLKEFGGSLDDAIYAQVSERLEGIHCCLKSDLSLPALVLPYSSIDSMAWLNMPEGSERVRGCHFRDWVERYMLNLEKNYRKAVTFDEEFSLEVPTLPCSADDLYSARCGLVHSWTAESDLVSKARAKRLLYFSGGLGIDEVEQATQPAQRVGAIFLKIETLVEVFRQGVTFFKHDMATDEDVRRRVEGRARHFLLGFDL